MQPIQRAGVVDQHIWRWVTFFSGNAKLGLGPERANGSCVNWSHVMPVYAWTVDKRTQVNISQPGAGRQSPNRHAERR
jgi:hypothetical protein